MAVRLTAIRPDGQRLVVELSGSVAAAARLIAAAPGHWLRLAADEPAIRTRDIVLIELLDGEAAVVPPGTRR